MTVAALYVQRDGVSALPRQRTGARPWASRASPSCENRSPAFRRGRLAQNQNADEVRQPKDNMAVRKKSAGAPASLELRRLQEATIEVEVRGLTPIIPHKWAEKAIRMMPGHPDGDSVKAKKGVREPEEEAEACTYRLEDGRPGMPATAFKAAIIGACRFFDKPSMTEAKQLIFVEGEGSDMLVPIAGTVQMRNGGEGEPARNANGGADLRYRNEIIDWTAIIKIRYLPSSMSANSVIALVDAAGRGGVGDWRPSSPKSHTGTYGTWRVNVEGDV